MPTHAEAVMQRPADATMDDERCHYRALRLAQ